jgi:drug/metabolite transporter (DMT)-like permease
VTRRGWLLFGSLCVIWGIPYLLIRVSVRELTPATLVFGRTALASALLLPVAAKRGELRPLIAGWRPLLVFAVIEIAAPWLLLGSAEQRLTSSLTGLLLAAVPLIGAVVAGVTGDDDPLGGRRLVGLLLGLAGVSALVGLDVGGTSITPLAEVGIVAVCYAVGPIVLSRSLSELPRLGVIAVSLTACAIGYAPVAALQLPSRLPAGRVLASVATLAVVCTAVAFIVFFALIAEVGPARATVITYVNPAVAALLGVTVLSEPFTLGMAAGFALVLAGSVLATQPGRSRGGRPEVATAEP